MLIIIPVHGTGDGNPRLAAGEPAWWSPESYFALIMHDSLELGGQPHFLWSPFCWSGDNTESQRIKGARDLAQRIREDVRDHGADTEFLVIAHSHGGNVAIEAMVELFQEDLEKEKRQARRQAASGLPRALNFAQAKLGGLLGWMVKSIRSPFRWLLGRKKTDHNPVEKPDMDKITIVTVGTPFLHYGGTLWDALLSLFKQNIVRAFFYSPVALFVWLGLHALLTWLKGFANTDLWRSLPQFLGGIVENPGVTSAGIIGLIIIVLAMPGLLEFRRARKRAEAMGLVLSDTFGNQDLRAVAGGAPEDDPVSEEKRSSPVKEGRADLDNRQRGDIASAPREDPGGPAPFTNARKAFGTLFGRMTTISSPRDEAILGLRRACRLKSFPLAEPEFFRFPTYVAVLLLIVFFSLLIHFFADRFSSVLNLLPKLEPSTTLWVAGGAGFLALVSLVLRSADLASRWFNGFVGSTVRERALGNDVWGRPIRKVSDYLPHLNSKWRWQAMPQEADYAMGVAINYHAQEAWQRAREILLIADFAGDLELKRSIERANIVDWNSLVHTTYFRVPLIAHLIAYLSLRTRGITNTALVEPNDNRLGWRHYAEDRRHWVHHWSPQHEGDNDPPPQRDQAPIASPGAARKEETRAKLQEKLEQWRGKMHPQAKG